MVGVLTVSALLGAQYDILDIKDDLATGDHYEAMAQ
jgi:hypothetical protein